MKEHNLKYGIFSGLSVAFFSFLFLVIGVRFILSNDLVIQNIIAFLILSIILGGISAIFIYYRLKIAAVVFLAGILIGFVNLYTMFMKDLSGWGDLAGFMAFLGWIIIGFISGIITQLVIYLYQKWKKNRI